MGKSNRNGFFTQLVKKFSTNRRNNYHYFLWRNGLNNSGKFNFTGVSEDDFIKNYLDGNKTKFKRLQMWELTDEYQGLMQKLYEFKMNQDFYKLYEIYLKKASDGDSQAVNALKIIKKEIESLNSDKPKAKNKEENKEVFDLK